MECHCLPSHLLAVPFALASPARWIANSLCYRIKRGVAVTIVHKILEADNPTANFITVLIVRAAFLSAEVEKFLFLSPSRVAAAPRSAFHPQEILLRLAEYLRLNRASWLALV